MSFFSELRRRKVVRTALVYVALGWVGVEVASTLGQVFAWPDWVVRGIVVAIFFGLPVAVVVSWMFDLTPEGFRPDAGPVAGGGSAAPSVAPHEPTQLGEASQFQSAPPIARPAPAHATPFLGRDEALASAAARIRSGSRVLTVTGPGGTGKTRFSCELFNELRAAYPDGHAWVSIAAVERAEDVMPTVAVALDIAEAHGRSAVDAVATVIGDRRVILLLDNLEQVLGVATEVADLVARCPHLQLITTSRAPLKIGAETEFALPPLGVPPKDSTPTEDLSLYPAVQLFVQRATKVKPDFRLDAGNGTAVAAICRRLDGLPLALELAAARIRILRPSELLARLDRALDVLTSGDRDLPERQRTLRATVDWSYSLLDASEQQLLRRTCVFAEGWTYEAMEAVCFEAENAARALDELDSLVEKGLVQVAGEGGRYLQLETIRAFAAERLSASGEEEAIREAHANFFTSYSARIYEGITGGEQLEWMKRAKADNANTIKAVRHFVARAREGDPDALENGQLMCGYLSWYWHIVGLHLTAREPVDELLRLSEGRKPSLGRSLAQWTASMLSAAMGEMERAVTEAVESYDLAEAVGNRRAKAQAALGAGFTQLMAGRPGEARTVLQEGVSLSADIGDDFLHAFNQTVLGILLGMSGDHEQGRRVLAEAQATQARIGDFEGRGLALSGLAQITFAQGDGERALELYVESLRSFEKVGDRPEIARVYGEMGWTALAVDRPSDAARSFMSSLQTHDEVGSSRGVGLALMGLAATEASMGNARLALTIAAAADQQSEGTGVVIEHPMGPGIGDQIEAIKMTLSEDEIRAVTERGRSLSTGEVLSLVTSPEGAGIS